MIYWWEVKLLNREHLRLWRRAGNNDLKISSRGRSTNKFESSRNEVRTLVRFSEYDSSLLLLRRQVSQRSNNLKFWRFIVREKCVQGERKLKIDVNQIKGKIRLHWDAGNRSENVVPRNRSGGREEIAESSSKIIGNNWHLCGGLSRATKASVEAPAEACC